MMSKNYVYCIGLLVSTVLLYNCRGREEGITIRIYPDSVLNDVSHQPVGINVDYLMDDDRYLKPSRRTADALKAMGVKYLRYPGGNKSDLYLFSVPPYEKAVPKLARTGNGAVGYERVVKDHREYKSDVMDFDEFIALCREADAEPVVVVAADEYLVDYPEGCTWTSREDLIRNAVEWVRYANINKGYRIKYWMIGNESWHKDNRNSTAAIYAKDVVDFSVAMKAVDSSVYIIPNGNSVEFFRDVLTIAAGHIDYLCLSNYPVWNYTAGYVSYRDTLKDLMGPVKRALNAISLYASEADKKKLKLIVAEYGPFDWAYQWPMINDMGHNLCNFEMTGEQLKVPEIAFSCFWNTRWIDNDSIENSVYDALDKQGNFNANGLGLMIWGNYLGNKMVETTATLHIRSFASYTPEEGQLYVYLINKGQEPAHASVAIENYSVREVEVCGMLTGEGPEDTDPDWNDQVRISVKDLNHLSLPGTSIMVLKLKLTQQ